MTKRPFNRIITARVTLSLSIAKHPGFYGKGVAWPCTWFDKLTMTLAQRTVPAYCVLLVLCLVFFSCKKNKLEINFQEINTGTPGDMNSIFFVNDSVGYACGGERYLTAVILKTTDRGNTWVAQSPNIDKALYKPFFINADTGFVAAYEGKILHTVDGGANWQLYQNYLWQPARDITFINDSVGFSCGGGGFSRGIICRTTDMGNSWKTDTFKNELRGLFFTDAQTGYCCGYGIILKTTDAGIFWQPTDAKGDFFTSIYFTNESTGYVVGLTGTILKTSDAGASWEKLRNGNSLLKKKLNFTQIVFRDALTGYAIGWDGLMLKTTDGGESWKTIDNAPSADFNGIFLTTTGGFIAASGGRLYSFVD